MKTYYIFEHHSQSTLRYQQFRHTGGFEAVGLIDAPNKPEAMEKWLCGPGYDLTDKEPGKLIECASERVVWEQGDTSGEFGDFVVRAYTLDEIEEDQNLYRAAKHLIQC